MNEESRIESNLPDKESKAEATESNMLLAVEMLENPTNNDFIQGLNKFAAWEKTLL